MEYAHHLIEHILNLLSFLQDNGLDFTQLEQGRSLALDALPDCRTAYEILRFMDEIPGGFLIYRADGDEQIICANQGLLHIFQCATFQEFCAHTRGSFRGLVHPDDLESVEESIQQQIASSRYDLDYVEYRITRKDGAIRWIEDYGHFIRSPGVGDFFYVFLSDATERREHFLREQALERARSEERLNALIRQYDQERALANQEHLHGLEVIEGLSANYESIFYVDLDSDLLLPYRSSLRTELLYQEEPSSCGYQRYMTDYVARWVHPEDRAAVEKVISPDALRAGLGENGSCYVNYRAITLEDDVQYLQLRFLAVGSGDTSGQLVMGCRRIDSELRQELEQKQLLAEALEKANLAIEAKNTFLSNMSHDMRTPLNAIFGFNALARKHIGNDKAVLDYLKRADASGRLLLDLINKVLELSWNDSSLPDIVEEECDLLSITKEAHSFLLPQAEEKNLSFILDCSGVEHSLVYSDREKLKQLFLYLLNNAVTYTEPGGEVSITALELERLSDHSALYQFIVQDTGIGISAEFLERIFEPFTREKNTTLSGIHGIGLGLTISKNIVDMMGGTIDVQSTVNQGSTFTITLQLRTRPQDAPTPEEPPVSQPASLHILLVEDNEINLEIERALLEGHGFTVEPAVDGSIAVEAVRTSPPGTFDLVLMDIQMPVMDGWQATRAIRQLDDPARARIPIIALSANTFESDIRKSLDSGMDAHLPKPMNIPLLLQTISETFAKYR